MALAATALSASISAQVDHGVADEIGIAALDSAGEACLAIRAPGLAPGTAVTLVWVPSDTVSWSPEILSAEIAAPLPDLCDIPEGAQYRDSSYRITARDGEMLAGTAYFALLLPREAFAVSGKRVRVDLDHDGMPEELRVCTSSEGLHLTVWSGAPLEGTRRWHRYYYLGYDVVPGCTEADYRGPTTP